MLDMFNNEAEFQCMIVLGYCFKVFAASGLLMLGQLPPWLDTAQHPHVLTKALAAWCHRKPSIIFVNDIA